VETAETLFGREIAHARVARGLSQEELGHRAGIHVSYVSQLERGLKSPSLRVILKIAEALDLPAHEFVKAVEASMRRS
jgi:transcriptional regulator with XRE-family HTH domain